MLSIDGGKSVGESAVDPGAQEYLTYVLGPEEYALDILQVQEIRGYDEPITIANAPPSLKGVINLRGTIVPIVDLRVVFGIGGADYTPLTVVIILCIARRVIGIVVDGVSDVVMLRDGDIHPAPELSPEIEIGHIRGLCSFGQRRLIVVDIEALIMSTVAAPSSRTKSRI